MVAKTAGISGALGFMSSCWKNLLLLRGIEKCCLQPSLNSRSPETQHLMRACDWSRSVVDHVLEWRTSRPLAVPRCFDHGKVIFQTSQSQPNVSGLSSVFTHLLNGNPCSWPTFILLSATCQLRPSAWLNVSFRVSLKGFLFVPMSASHAPARFGS